MKAYAILLVLVLTMGTVFAAWNDSVLSYWSFDAAYTNSTNATSNGVNVSGFWQGTPPANVSCIVRECRYFTAATSFLNITRSLMLSTANNTYTMTAWIYPTSASLMVWAGAQDAGGSNGVNFFTDATPKIFANKVGIINLDNSYTYVNKWSHLVFVQNQTGMYWYLNGTMVANNTDSTNFATSSLLYGAIGRRAFANSAPSSDQQYTGYIDEIGFWQRALTPTEIAQSYNLGAGFNPFLDSPSGEYAKIESFEYGSSTPVLNFTAYFNDTINGTTSFNTTNGTINLPFLYNNNLSYTFTLNSTDYFSMSYTDYNWTSSGQTLTNYFISRTNLSIQFFDEDTFAPLTNVSYQIVSAVSGAPAKSGNLSSGFLSFDDLLGDYEIRYNATGYVPRSYFISIPLPTTDDVNLSLFDLQDVRADSVLVKVTDKSGRFVDGLTVSLLRRYVVANTTQFYIVEQAKPIQQLGGQTVFNVVPNVIPYIFRVTDATGEVLYQGSGTTADDYETTYIINNQMYIKIDVGEDVINAFSRIGSVSLALTNTTDTFFLSYDNLQASFDSMCLVVKENNRDVLSTQCSTADGAILSYTVPAANNTYYVATAEMYSNEIDNVTGAIGFIDKTLTTAQAFNWLGLVLLALTIGIFSIAFASNPVTMVIMQSLAFIAFGTWFLNITMLSITMQATIFVFGIIVAFMLGGRN